MRLETGGEGQRLCVWVEEALELMVEEATVGLIGLLPEVAEDAEVVGDGYGTTKSDIGISGTADANLGTKGTLRDTQVLGSLVQDLSKRLHGFVCLIHFFVILS